MLRCNACGTGKAARSCPRVAALLCGRCCAQRRDDECGDCRFHRDAARYHASRHRTMTRTGKTSDRRVQENVEAFLALAEARRFDAAWEQARPLQAQYPDDPFVLFGIGTLYAMQDRHEEAVSLLQRATEIAPFFVEAHHNKAMSYRRMLDIGNTVRSFRKVVQMGDPTDDYVVESNKFLRDMDAMIRREYGIDLDTYIDLEAEFDRAFAHMQDREWSQALEGFRTCIARNDRHPPTHGNMAICLAALGRKAEALAEIDRALAIEPGYEPAKINRRMIEDLSEGESLDTARALCVDYGKLRVQSERRLG